MPSRCSPGRPRSIYRPAVKPHAGQISAAAKLIAAARRPVYYVGGGVLKAHATEQLEVLAELTDIPVVTTLMARGAFPDSHSQHLGMPGMHGTVAAVAAMQRTGVIVALGARFDDRVTGQLSTFAPDATIIHAASTRPRSARTARSTYRSSETRRRSSPN